MPATLVAVHVTELVPTAKVLPETGTQLMWGSGNPVAFAVNCTTAEHSPISFVVTMLFGHTITGATPCNSAAPMSTWVLKMRAKPRWSVLKLLAENGLNQVPVVDNGRVLGMLSRADVLRFLQFRDELGLGAACTPKAQPRSIG